MTGGSLFIARILRLVLLIIIFLLGLLLAAVVVIAPKLAEALLEICLLLGSCLGSALAPRLLRLPLGAGFRAWLARRRGELGDELRLCEPAALDREQLMILVKIRVVRASKWNCVNTHPK